MITQYFSLTQLKGSRVDRENNIIKGVSLIALGDARGHNKAVDVETLKSVCECAREYGEGLRVKFNPQTFTHGAGSLAGFIASDSLRVKGGKALGDLHIYKTFSAEAREYLFEILERTPGNIGLSIEFSGDDEEIKGQKFARCEEIFAATIVDLPAANPTGMFAAGSLTKDHKDQNSADNGDSTMNEEQVTKLTTNLTESITKGIAAGFEALKQQFAAVMPPKKDEEKDKAEMLAAGCTDGDTDDQKQQKLSAYRAANKPVSNMSAKELGEVITKTNMQFFRETGGKPAKASVEGGGGGTKDEFESLIENQLAAGAKNRGRAIQLARQLNGAAYNAWMQKKHPNVQQMEAKK